MTEQEVIRAVAELDECDPLHVPDYLRSYDALIPVIEKQPEAVLKKFMDIAYEMYNVKELRPIGPFLKPAQLCECLLRATNRWKDPKTYELDPHGDWIKCLRCDRTSHHPEDVKNRYCGHCHIFHDDE